jgi:hypothetical protein
MAYGSLLRRGYFSKSDFRGCMHTAVSLHNRSVFFGVIVVIAIIEVGAHATTTLFTSLILSRYS